MLAAILWEQHWVDKTVQFHCDKHAIVHCIQTCSSKEPLVAQLPCGLFMLAACLDFHPVASHIARLDSGLADSLSRNVVSSFTLQAPVASKHDTSILLGVAAMFQNPKMD